MYFGSLTAASIHTFTVRYGWCGDEARFLHCKGYSIQNIVLSWYLYKTKKIQETFREYILKFRTDFNQLKKQLNELKKIHSSQLLPKVKIESKIFLLRV